MEFSVSLPLDVDGFLARQCPSCEGRFKWHHGDREDKPEDVIDPPVYFCPLCAHTAEPDEWFTHEQVEHIQAQVAAPITDRLSEELEDSLKSLNDGMLKASVDVDVPDAPGSPTERHDMSMVEPPCHSWEPVKVPDWWNGRLFCLFCGRAYTVD